MIGLNLNSKKFITIILPPKTSRKTYSLTAAGATPSGSYTTDSYNYYGDGWGDLLASYKGYTISYDGIGNPLSYYDSRFFTWEGRRLKGATNGSVTMSFKYNDEGIRTSKTVNGVTTNYYLNGTQIIAEETNGNITEYLYNSTGVIGFRYRASSYAADSWDLYFFEKNLQGDIVAVYTSSGVKKISYIYDAWGNFAATYYNGASATNLNNPFTYRGYYYDKDLGLYYLNSRYYDSQTGRFISADVFEAVTAIPNALTDKNLYAYCDNNPVMRIDDGGTFWLKALVGAIVGTVTEYVSDVVYNVASGKTGWDVFVPSSSAVDYVAAAARGAFDFTPIGKGASKVVNALINTTVYSAKQYEKGESINSAELIYTAMSGIAFSKPGLFYSDQGTSRALKIVVPSDVKFEAVRRIQNRATVKFFKKAFLGATESYN